MDDFMKYLPYFLPLILIHYTLAIIALIDLVKRKKIRFINNKFVWGAIILFVELFGPIIYLIAKGDEE